jgi:hypothetical protein
MRHLAVAVRTRAAIRSGGRAPSAGGAELALQDAGQRAELLAREYFPLR